MKNEEYGAVVRQAGDEIKYLGFKHRLFDYLTLSKGVVL